MNRLILVLLAALAASPVLAQGRPDLVAASMRDPSRQYVPNQMLVQFRASSTEAGKDRAIGSINGRMTRHLRRGEDRTDGKGDLHLATLPPGLTVEAAMRNLERDPDVDFVEPNWIHNHQAISNDPYFTNGALWGMYGDGSTPTNRFGTQAAEAWAAGRTNCRSVYVGIIDEGVMRTHVELAGNFGVNPGEIAGDGIDNDGNGYIDDVYGWDFVGNNNQTFDGVGDDHGTHVAGIIGAKGGNGAGVAGMCWSIRMINAKFLGSAGGTTANAIRAIDYMTDLKKRHGINLVATNNSWGGGGFSQLLMDAIRRANDAGILFIAAAGNSATNIDVTPFYPASYKLPNVITVASITSVGALSSFSNYGANSVHIAAPGSGIWSTVPAVPLGSTTIYSGLAAYSGTSMAAPHVTGAVAMYAAKYPYATAAQIREAILNLGVPTSSLTGKTTTGKRLDVSRF
jgi:subtilisin family serine protease